MKYKIVSEIECGEKFCIDYKRRPVQKCKFLIPYSEHKQISGEGCHRYYCSIFNLFTGWFEEIIHRDRSWELVPDMKNKPERCSKCLALFSVKGEQMTDEPSFSIQIRNKNNEFETVAEYPSMMLLLRHVSDYVQEEDGVEEIKIVCKYPTWDEAQTILHVAPSKDCPGDEIVNTTGCSWWRWN